MEDEPQAKRAAVGPASPPGSPPGTPPGSPPPPQQQPGASEAAKPAPSTPPASPPPPTLPAATAATAATAPTAPTAAPAATAAADAPWLSLQPLPPPLPAVKLSAPLLQVFVNQMQNDAQSALAGEAQAAAAGGQASMDRHRDALDALSRLALDYAGELSRDLFNPLALLQRRPVPAMLPCTATSLEEEIKIRQRLASKYYDKLKHFVHQWQAYMKVAADMPMEISGPATVTCGHWHRQWPLYQWLLAHVKAHPVTTENVLYATEEGMLRDGLDVEAALDLLSELYAFGVLAFPFKRQYLAEEKIRDMMPRLRRYTPVVDRQPRKPHNITFLARSIEGRQLFPLVFLDPVAGDVGGPDASNSQSSQGAAPNGSGQDSSSQKQANGLSQNGEVEAGRAFAFVHDDRDYLMMEVLVDYFQEENRLQAKRSDAPGSVLTQWSDPAVVRQVLQKSLAKYHGWDPFSLRETVYEELKECTQFKPTLVVAVIRLFKARRMLDFSAGWGDRLAGAIAADVDDYLAFDPNVALRAGHGELIRRFVEPSKQSRFNVIYAPFEEAPLPADRKFDLVFTSPPFFDFEVYTAAVGQSVDRYRTLESWLVRFLLHSIKRAWSVLEAGGHVVIHITDVFKTKVCEKMCLLVQWQLSDAIYRGVLLSVGSVGKPRPLWVFQKALPASAAAGAGPQLAAHAEAELRRLYPEVWQEAIQYLYPVVVAASDDVEDEEEAYSHDRR